MKRSLTMAAVICALVMCMPTQAAPKNPQDKGGGKPGGDSKAKDWFLQTRVLVEENGEMLVLDDRSGVIGRLDGALDGKDDHDIRAFVNVNGSAGAIVLTHGEEWGDDAGQYLSDYRPSGADRQVWTLAVTSNRPNATVTLYWEGLNEITPKPDGGFDWTLNNGNSTLKTLRLVDLETGVVTEAVGKRNAINSYTFDMNGAGERLFRWVQGDVLPEDLALSSAISLRAFGPLETQSRAEAFTVPAAEGFGSPPSLDAPVEAGQPAQTPSTREQ